MYLSYNIAIILYSTLFLFFVVSAVFYFILLFLDAFPIILSLSSYRFSVYALQ